LLAFHGLSICSKTLPVHVNTIDTSYKATYSDCVIQVCTVADTEEEKKVNGIGISWVAVSIALLVVCPMALAMFWQIMRRREAAFALLHYKVQLEQLQQQSQQQEAGLREQMAAARAEKAHAEQLQRQLMFAQESWLPCAKSTSNCLPGRPKLKDRPARCVLSTDSFFSSTSSSSKPMGAYRAAMR
jgi:hypothetical protein